MLRSSVTALVFGVAFVHGPRRARHPDRPAPRLAGVVGVALGFGAQSLVKDFLSGIFMLVEDQYGVGDVIDTGEAIGTVEDVGLRVTRLRDGNGVVWYVRNGEIVRIGNRSQGFAPAIVDLPVAVQLGRGRGGAAMQAARTIWSPRTTSPMPCWRSRRCSASSRSTWTRSCCG